MRILLNILLAFAFAGAAFAQTRPMSNSTARPDVYPSRRAAAAAIAEQIGSALSSNPALSASSRIVIAPAPESLATEELCAVEDVASELRHNWPNAEFSREKRRSVDGINLVVRVTRNGAVTEVESVWESGNFLSRFIDKPWAADWTAYVNADTNHRWLRGDSPRTAVSQEEAIDKACADAANKLLALVKAQMNINAAGRASNLVADGFVLSRTKSMLASGTAVRDRFVQRYERPYGDVWQARVLIDGSPGKIDTIARGVADQARAAHNQQMASLKKEVIEQTTAWGSLVAFLGIIVLLYWFLNAATKGYFTWRLRCGAVALIVFGILAVLFLSWHTFLPRTFVVRQSVQMNQ